MNPDILQRFRDDRFGCFIHWGLYALPGGRWKGETAEYVGEWLQSRFRIPHAEYALLAKQFNPVGFDADAWVRSMYAAGMRYLVYTSKHHDGFAMYHSKVSAFNIADATPFGRDPLAELAEACRKYGVRLGLYYSHCLDWSDPDAGDPGPDSPLNFGMSWGNDWDFPDRSGKDFDRYFRRKCLPQLDEILSNYGDIAVLWLDCPMGIDRKQIGEIIELVRDRQPECLINSRIGMGFGDYGSMGDNQKPLSRGEFPLETPATLNDTWGFKWDDHNWKSAATVARELASLCDADANYLLNIGPGPDGTFPDAAQKILEELAQWMLVASPAVHGVSGSPFRQPLNDFWCTRSANKLHFFVKDAAKPSTLNGLRGEVAGFTCSGGLLPIVSVAFAGAPEVDERLIPQGGVLELTAPLAELRQGRESTAGAGSVLGAAAEVIAAEGQAELTEDGGLARWHHPGDALAWRIAVPEGGRYQVEVRTVNCQHSIPWVGAREVKVTFGGAAVTAGLRPDFPEDSHYYAAARSLIGILEIPAGAEGEIVLENLGIDAEEAVYMNFACLILRQL